ncbi:hypothetical protein SEA_WALTZ_32 [Arthrobacter phage Waltz]|nr:hypothetical protein SEA_WALTZ_32 [Arthrobacter phage Waltz]
MTPRKGPIGHLLTAAVRFTGWLIFAVLDARKSKDVAKAPLPHSACKCRTWQDDAEDMYRKASRA